MIFGWILIFLSALVVSVTLLVVGGKIAPNGLIGIRTPATQRDDSSWRAGHAAAARILVPGFAVAATVGVLLAIGLAGDSSETVGGIALAGFIVVVVVSAFVADRAARALTG